MRLEKACLIGALPSETCEQPAMGKSRAGKLLPEGAASADELRQERVSFVRGAEGLKHSEGEGQREADEENGGTGGAGP